MIVGTAGHIDHGKTTLVKALTGVDADRLQEEKARGITIDLGYAYQALPGGEVLGFVDVPGHERFIHNMLAGATGIDYVILVVAADDGPMPQTREHLAILELLGLTQGVVALTKVDRVDAARREAALAEVRAMLDASPCRGFDVLPVSSVTGEGVPELHLLLQKAAARLAPRHRASGHFRLAVDRSFTLAGIGTVVTGTVHAGRVAVGDHLTITPLGVQVRVRGLHAQNRVAEAGGPGQRCALNLVAPQLDKRDITRGQWVVGGPLHAPTDRIDGELALLAAEGKPLAHWTPVHVHLGATHATGRVALLQDEPLAPGARALVQLVLDAPIGALHGDRYILRDQSAQRTLGGGRVLDAYAPARGRAKPQRRALLEALAAPTAAEALALLIERQASGVDLDGFARLFNLDAAELDAMVQAQSLRLQRPDKAAGPTLAFSPAHWSSCGERLRERLRAFHAEDPDSAGATLDTLRAALPERPAAAVVASMLDGLVAAGEVVRVGSRFRLRGHEVKLTAAEQTLWERARPALGEGGLAPAPVAELARRLGAKEELLRNLFVKLVRMGALHRVRREVFFLPATIASLAEQTERLAHEHPKGIITVGPFRERTGLHRNLGIPMLEYFDRAGLTLRRDDGRRLRRDVAAVFGTADAAAR